MHWYSSYIKNEILFWFLLLAFLPLMFLTSVNYFYQKTNYLQQSQQQLKLLLDEKILDLNQEVQLITRQMKILSQMPSIKQALRDSNQLYAQEQLVNLTRKEYEAVFAEILSENQFYDILLINAQGDIVFSLLQEADFGTSLIDGPYAGTNLAKAYQSSSAFLDIEFSDFEYYPPSFTEAAFSVIPIYGENRILGALAIQVNRSRILKNLSNYRGLGKTGEYVAARLSKNGDLLPAINMRFQPEALHNEFRFPHRDRLPTYLATTGNNGYGVTTDYRGQEVVAAWSYVPSLRWGLVAKIDIDEVLMPINELRFYSILVMFFVGLGILLFILSSIRRIVEPIERLTKGVQRFSDGATPDAIEVNVHNEIGKLAQTFNQMAISLSLSQKTNREYASSLEQKVQDRTAELQQAKNRLQTTNHELKEFMNVIDQYIITSTTDRSGKILKVSQAFSDITGFSKEELIGRKHNLIRHPDMPAEIYTDMWQTLSQGEVWKGEIKNQRKDGTAYWVDTTISPVFDQQGEIKEFTSIRQDITDRKKVEELSITDQLTKLYNRRKIDEVFAQEIARVHRYQQIFAVIILDIDWFKTVNDKFGHNIGDLVLVKVAEELTNQVRQTDVVGRWGGEEFLILCPQTTVGQAKVLAENIRQVLEQIVHPEVGTVTASFGVAEFTPEDNQISVLKRADLGLYKSKENGRNQVSIG